MQVLHNPPRTNWPALCRRPVVEADSLSATVESIAEEVRRNGDAALKSFTARFDGVQLSELGVPDSEWSAAASQLDEPLRDAIALACDSIERFHAAQREAQLTVETVPGVTCWRRSIAIERVGLYIPGGSAPLFSTLLMLGIPAKLAGCRQIVVTTPPRSDGTVAPAILYAAQRIGIENIYKVGGAHAIAALAHGTESVPAVDKIFGPGNQYVTAAKMLAQRHGIAIDLPAGPSEVLVIADETCEPTFVAADLLSQAEHGPDSQVVLVSDSEKVVNRVIDAVTQAVATLPRRSIAETALQNSRAVVVSDLDEAIDFSNEYAPEHLILAVAEPDDLAERVINAGSVFLGHYTPESLGDYASGTNHTLPTNGFARSYSGVSLDSFVRKVTFQRALPDGLQRIGPAVVQMAEAESLEAHAMAVRVRLAQLNEKLSATEENRRA
jgi:histidinol dehydrogenase